MFIRSDEDITLPEYGNDSASFTPHRRSEYQSFDVHFEFIVVKVECAGRATEYVSIVFSNIRAWLVVLIRTEEIIKR